MAAFQLVMARGSAGGAGGAGGIGRAVAEPPPHAARVAGLLSVLLWAAVVLLGRWIGFTKGYDFTIPAELDLSFPG